MKRLKKVAVMITAFIMSLFIFGGCGFRLPSFEEKCVLNFDNKERTVVINRADCE